jgi:hypothetical protein
MRLLELVGETWGFPSNRSDGIARVASVARFSGKIEPFPNRARSSAVTTLAAGMYHPVRRSRLP